MFVNLLKGALSGAVLVASFISTPLFAAASDYKFELVKVEAFESKITDVTVKLTHIPDGKLVPDAVIFETKANMAPSGMEGMTGQTLMPPTSGAPGTYHIRIKTGMAGTWALALVAKVQDETETVRGTVNFDAK